MFSTMPVSLTLIADIMPKKETPTQFHYHTAADPFFVTVLMLGRSRNKSLTTEGFYFYFI